VFGKFADFVRQGVLAAAKADPAGRLAITVYSTSDDPNAAIAAYEQAIAQGNRLIIGPLTRDSVTRLAQRINPQTTVLALNSPESSVATNDNFYVFSLQVEAEARQVARMAFAEGRRNALTVADTSPLAKRTLAAFNEEFIRQGGKISARFEYSTGSADLTALRESAHTSGVDTVFLALDASRARLIRPYTDGPAQVYATSHVLDGPPERLRDAELNGVRFVDMPWLLEPDHPAVMTYARAQAVTPVAGDSERLYAFGIDAYRIAADLAREARVKHEPLDGVTGRISMSRERHFVRELTAAQYADGRPLPIATRH
jgi:hypothetical protein